MSRNGCFAALNTLEPPLFQMAMIDLTGDPTGPQRRPALRDWANRALTGIDKQLARHAHIAGADFTVADILTVTVLREARQPDVLDGFPKVKDYAARCQQRPAWRRTQPLRWCPCPSSGWARPTGTSSSRSTASAPTTPC